MQNNSFFHSARNLTGKASPCKELALTAALFLLPSLIASPQPDGSEFNNPRFLLLTMTHGAAQAALLLYLVTHIGQRRPADYSILPVKPRHLLFGLLAGLPIFPLLLLLSLALAELPPEYLTAALPPFRWTYTNYSLLPLLLPACLATGLWEELYFRAYLPAELHRLGAPPGLALLAPAGLFAALHIYEGPTGFAAALLLGLYFSWVLRAAKNITVPVITHAFYNLTVLLASGPLSAMEKYL
ncbi:MAG: CPBP family intramembrane metalloprotease [Spirochaetales bacterium]|jgi:membrane protease YdiL (CAAX protease family)|nr:CPBP family intramembrane metalloprotease [Spirochaetales bacterium]